MAISNRIISAIVDQNMGGIWDAMIEQKNQQLKILSNQQQNLYEEARSLKDRLLNVGATVPETSSSSDFEKAKNIPIAFVGDNLRNMEGMVKYSQGQVDSLETALNEFNQGQALMGELSDTYAGLDAVDQYGPDAYRNYMVEGDIDDVGESVYSGIKGGTPYNEILYEDQPGSEMAQLFAQLTPEQKTLYETSTQFREGFQAGNTRDIAVQKNIEYLQTEQLSNEILNQKKEQVFSNIDKYQDILKERGIKLTSDLKSQIKIGGMAPQMINLALTAGDTESFNKYMDQINTNQNYSLIHDEIGTMLQAYNADNPYPVINTLGNIYEEFENRLAMEDRWLADMPPTMGADGVTPVGPGIDLIRNAKKGRFRGMDPAIEKDAREYYRLYKRYEQFIGSGLMPNEDDLKHALTLNNTAEFLTTTELNFLSNASGKNIDTYYREGLPIDEEDLALMLEGKYEPGYEESTIDEIMLAHSEWIDLQGAGGDDNLGTVELNDLIESQNAIYADKDADKLSNRNLVTAQQNLSRYYQGFYSNKWKDLPSVIASGQAHRGHPGGDVAYFAKDEKLLLEDIATMEAEVKRQASRYVSKSGYGFLGLTGSGGNQETAVKLLQAWDEYKEALLSNFERYSTRGERRADISEDVLRYLDPSSVPKQTRGTGARGALTPEEWDELQRSLQQP